MCSSEFAYRAYQVIESLEAYFRMFFAVTVLTVVSDVKDFVFIVVMVTALNWLAGYLADRRKGKPYQHKKTMQAVKELFLTSAILFFVALTCNMLEPGVDYRILIRGLTGIFLIIYARNITRNLRVVQPGNKFVKVLNSIANTKYFQLKKEIKDCECDLPIEEGKEEGKEDGKQQ